GQPREASFARTALPVCIPAPASEHQGRAAVDETLEQYARRLAARSELLETVASVRRDGGVALALGDAPLRPLFKPEVAQLEALGNTAEDWSRVRVANGFNPRRVRNCEFRGAVVLGEFKRRVLLADGVEVIAGVSNTTLVDCVV